jgi:hypothetical protein
LYILKLNFAFLLARWEGSVCKVADYWLDDLSLIPSRVSNFSLLAMGPIQLSIIYVLGILFPEGKTVRTDLIEGILVCQTI